MIAALMTRADLLMMDEPTSGLDPIMEQAFRQSVLEAKGRGQTIFLSSHILEEVEAVCDRLAILRSGSSWSWERWRSCVTSRPSPSRRHSKAPRPHWIMSRGVSNVQVEGSHVTFNVRGAVDPVLRVIADHHPITLLSRQPSLEELFLALDGAPVDRPSSVLRITNDHRDCDQPVRAVTHGISFAGHRDRPSGCPPGCGVPRRSGPSSSASTQRQRQSVPPTCIRLSCRVTCSGAAALE